MFYKIKIREIHERIVVVEAENEDEAFDNAISGDWDCEVNLEFLEDFNGDDAYTLEKESETFDEVVDYHPEIYALTEN